MSIPWQPSNLVRWRRRVYRLTAAAARQAACCACVSIQGSGKSQARSGGGGRHAAGSMAEGGHRGAVQLEGVRAQPVRESFRPGHQLVRAIRTMAALRVKHYAR
jgi:hypothetical protein